MTKLGYKRLKEYRLRQSTGEQLPNVRCAIAPLQVYWGWFEHISLHFVLSHLFHLLKIVLIYRKVTQ